MGVLIICCKDFGKEDGLGRGRTACGSAEKFLQNWDRNIQREKKKLLDCFCSVDLRKRLGVVRSGCLLSTDSGCCGKGTEHPASTNAENSLTSYATLRFWARNLIRGVI
jgi:hypothetical protein